MLIEGKVNDIIYRNEKNGYTVATINTAKESVDCIGIMPFIQDGDTVRAWGEWSTHATYGEQFKIHHYERMKPCSEKDIIDYLASGIMKGIGPATAKKIVSVFGEKTLDVIRDEPISLSEVKGINVDKALKMGAEYMELNYLEEFVQYMQGFGIELVKSSKIYHDYGHASLETVKENPYMLAMGDYKIDFPTADRIAVEAGFDKESLYRAMSGVEFVLIQAASNGHTYYPLQSVYRAARKLLMTDDDSIAQAITHLQESYKIILSDDKEKIYLRKYYIAEKAVAQGLVDLCHASIPIEEKNMDDLIHSIQSQSNITFAEKQTDALCQAAANGVFVITGGPGTGKTTIINAIIKMYERIGMEIQIAAPTGRAAKRMSQATGIEAVTIHRLLEPDFPDHGSEMVFARNEEKPLDGDVVILDEVSMIDILLMQSLINALSPGTKLILVGDSDQLPSVGAGNVLRDILNSGVVPHVELTEVFRQAQESMIVVNAHKINHGIFPESNVKDKDFFFILQNGTQVANKAIVDICSKRLPAAYQFDPSKHIQVLTPTRKGDAGVGALNESLQAVLNPKNDKESQKTWNGFNYRVGDKVMQTKNNYNLPWERMTDRFEEGTGVFNGDMGILTEIDEESKRVKVLFDDDKTVWYDFSILDELEPAYAITVHKSQGCEFPVVVMPICNFHPMLMTRNLLYTAVTRAREMVILVGDEESLSKMVRNNKEQSRYSTLKENLLLAAVLTEESEFA